LQNSHWLSTGDSPVSSGSWQKQWIMGGGDEDEVEERSVDVEAEGFEVEEELD
jgi:hypothetical protein